MRLYQCRMLQGSPVYGEQQDRARALGHESVCWLSGVVSSRLRRWGGTLGFQAPVGPLLYWVASAPMKTRGSAACAGTKVSGCSRWLPWITSRKGIQLLVPSYARPLYCRAYHNSDNHAPFWCIVRPPRFSGKLLCRSFGSALSFHNSKGRDINVLCFQAAKCVYLYIYIVLCYSYRAHTRRWSAWGYPPVVSARMNIVLGM